MKTQLKHREFDKLYKFSPQSKYTQTWNLGMSKMFYYIARSQYKDGIFMQAKPANEFSGDKILK